MKSEQEVQIGDPRYCPEWQEGVFHGIHEYNYEYIDSDGQVVNGGYVCWGCTHDGRRR